MHDSVILLFSSCAFVNVSLHRPATGWTWHPTSWRKSPQTLCSSESQFMPNPKAPPSPPLYWVLVATPFTVTVNFYGWEDWPEKTTWRRAPLPRTSVPSISGRYLKRWHLALLMSLGHFFVVTHNCDVKKVQRKCFRWLTLTWLCFPPGVYLWPTSTDP